MSYFATVKVETPEHPLLNVFMNRQLSETTVAVLAVPDTRTLEVDDATGFIAGSWIGVFNNTNNQALSAQVIGVAVNVLTLDRVVNFAYEVGDRVVRAELNMNVNGSIAPVTFGIRSVADDSDIDLVVNVTRIIWSITDGVAMDDSKFGGIAALIKGCSLYVKRANGVIQHLFVIRNNGDLGAIAFDKRYNDKVGGGEFGMEVRLTFGSESKMGSVVKLRDGDDLFMDIQDDLTGLTSFRVAAQGFATLE